MSAPVVWIVLPGLAAFALYGLRRWNRATLLAEFFFCISLAILAWILPVNEPISLGIPNLPSLRLGDSLEVYGRRLVIGNTEKPIVILVYLTIGLWSGGALLARVEQLFAPLSLGIAATLTAAMVIEPTLYAALLIIIATLLCIPILSPPGQPIRNGAVRLLIFEVIGMSLILFADATMELLQIDPNNSGLLAPAMLFFGLGFAVAAGILPFHTWIPMLGEEAHPYAAALVFFILPISIALTGLKYFQTFAGMPIYPMLQLALQYAGVGMILAGGVYAGFESHLGRILGFAVMVQLGTGLVAISLGTQAMQGSALRSLFFAQLIPQGMALAIWALALSSIRTAMAQNQPTAPAMRFRAVQGLARQMPFAGLSLILANFSLAGFPLLGSFPGLLALWSALSQSSLPMTLLTLVGSASLFVAGLRSMAVLVMEKPGSSEGQESSQKRRWQIYESLPTVGLLIVGILVLFLIGMSPQWLLPMIAGLPAFIIQMP